MFDILNLNLIIHSLKYLKSMDIKGCKDIGIKRFEFVQRLNFFLTVKTKSFLGYIFIKKADI